jgi:hypothetical protein
MYKLIKNPLTLQINYVLKDGELNIPFDPANLDYEDFKYQINNDEATLEDADGVLMTPEEAKAYVATLP